MSARSGRIYKGLGSAGREQSLCGGSDKKGLGGALGMFSPLLLFRPNSLTSSDLLPYLSSPLRILPDLAHEIRAERGIMGKRVVDRGVWERVGSR